ncbi:MAG: hypothetical protein UY61_C0041G0008 [Candidatus Adlerbacteria bacterium GW2011_GWC1_50_9]|uniref:Sortilin N-terminal domain-containing protein n=1 Tax=Candidatus Adlerbacteria bacterium GW2011_GWC1_50_9 TaxID=1618608 RepID=A0A0G1YZ13_9BACT|nr:MAG: hypothetical protein UY61_C0041G0008 [Candidatus Adlerbacteria bacterium GW2011_GWC1_50_9]
MGKFLENKIAHIILIGVLAALVFLVILLQFAFAGSGIRRAQDPARGIPNIEKSLLIRSFDGGETWKPIFPSAGEENFPKGADITDFEFHPARTAEIFIATNKAGLWMSPDLGIHWRQIEGSALLGPESRVYAIALSKSEPAVLYVSVASRDGNVVLQSRDSGESFREIYRVSSRAGAVRAIAIDRVSSSHIILAKSDGELLESENSGKTWILGARFDDSPVRILQDPSRPKSFLIVMDSGGVQTTHDFGRTWEKVSMGEGGESPGSFFIPQPDGEPVRPPNFFENPFRFRKDAYDFASDPADFSEFVAITSRGIIRSSDGGVSWRGIETILDAEDTTKGALALLPARPESILFALGEDLYRSDDNGLWWKKLALPGATSRLVTHPTDSGVIFGILK